MPAASLTPVCEKCGYDLRGNPSATHCPECGWPVPPLTWFIRDGHLWIRPKGACLPNLCIVTGEAIKGQPEKKEGHYYPPIVFIPLLGWLTSCMCCFAPPDEILYVLAAWDAFCVLLTGFAYYALYRPYEVRFHLSPKAKQQNKLLRVVGRVLIAAGFFFPLIAAFVAVVNSMQLHDLVPLSFLGFVMLIVCVPVYVAYLTIATSQPRADAFDGTHFRLAGLSSAFLAAAAKLPGAVVVESADDAMR